MAFTFGGSASRTNTSEQGQSRSNTSGNEVSSQTTQRLDSKSIQSLTEVLNSLQAGLVGGKEYSKEAALQDSEGIVQQLFSQFSQTLLPQIISKSTGAGAYNSSAAQLLADNAFAETVGKAAEVKVNAIAQYAQAAATKQQTQAQTLGTILQGLLQSKETTNLNSLLNSTTNSTFSGTSKSTKLDAGAKLSIPG